MNSPRFGVISAVLSAAGCLALSSCATQMAINAAQGNPNGVAPNQAGYKTAVPNPAFYALVPLTLPFDLITLPIQFVTMNAQGAPYTGTPVAPPQASVQQGQVQQGPPQQGPPPGQ